MRAILSPELTLEELTELQAQTRDPMGYAAILCPAQNVQAAIHMDPVAGKIAIFQIAIALPKSLIELPTGGLLDAQGNSAASSKIKSAMPLPPMVRIVVARSILGADAKEQIEAIDAAKAAAEKDSG